jgi:hypothetical protein
MYIHTETKEFPLYEGDIRLVYPNMVEFVLPEQYAEVVVDPAPTCDITDIAERLPPELYDGQWVCKWAVRKVPDEDMEMVLYNYRLQTDTAFFRAEKERELAEAEQAANSLLATPGGAPDVIG